MQLHSVTKSWLLSQKITEEVLQDFNVICGETITFPVLDIDGNFSFNKYRRSPASEEGSKYWYDKGGQVTLYGWSKAKDSKTILITEGERDTLVAWSHNIPAITSTGGAMSFQEEWGELLKDKEVILCFDNDTAGAMGLVKALEYVPHAKVCLLPDKTNVKDITDFVLNGGDLNQLIQTAKHFTSLEAVIMDKDERKCTWRSTFFHDAFLKKHQQIKVTKERVSRKEKSTEKILNAKLYPIENLLTFVGKKAICPFHSEKTGSLFHNVETNNSYCFGQCNKIYDSIDVYQKQNGCTFIEAVKELNKLV